MKKHLFFLLLILSSCGPSKESKEEIAIITCNIIGESMNMDGVLRLTELNKARKEIGEDPFLGTDEDILFAFKNGICKSLVLNDPMYDSLVLQIKEEERREFERQQAELQRQREEKEEQERKMREESERKRKEDFKRFNDSVAKYFDLYPLRPKLVSISSSGNFNNPIVWLKINCSSSDGFFHEVVVKTKSDEIKKQNVCDGSSLQRYPTEDVLIDVRIEFSNYQGENKSGKTYDPNHPVLSEIESILFRLTGEISYSRLNIHLTDSVRESIYPLNYGLPYFEKFIDIYEVELMVN